MQSQFVAWKPRWLDMMHREWHNQSLTLLYQGPALHSVNPNPLWMRHPQKHQNFDCWGNRSSPCPLNQPGIFPTTSMPCHVESLGWTQILLLDEPHKRCQALNTFPGNSVVRQPGKSWSVHQKVVNPDVCTRSCLKPQWSSWWPHSALPSATPWSYHWWGEVVRDWRCSHWFCQSALQESQRCPPQQWDWVPPPSFVGQCHPILEGLDLPELNNLCREQRLTCLCRIGIH